MCLLEKKYPIDDKDYKPYLDTFTDKKQSDQNHSITKKDIQIILYIVPEYWFGVANVFRIFIII